MLFIHRDYNRTEHDDFIINVQHKLGELSSFNPLEAVPIYEDRSDRDTSSIPKILGWKIQNRTNDMAMDKDTVVKLAREATATNPTQRSS